MESFLLASLANNAALLLSLSLVYEIGFILPRRAEKYKAYFNGIAISLIGLAIMSVPFTLRPGLVYDTRTILISVTALTYGSIPTAIVVLTTSIFRLINGGVGALPGVATIVSSAAIGLLWRRYGSEVIPKRRWLNIYIFSVLVHVTMLGCMFLLPYPNSIEVIRAIARPILLIYPVATVLLSLLLYRQQEHNQAVTLKIEAEGRYRSLFENNQAVMLLIDPNTGSIVDANHQASRFYGWSLETLKTMNMAEINTMPLAQVRQEMEKAVLQNKNRFVFRHRRADQSIRDVEVYSGPISIDQRQLLYSIVHDISDRIEVEHNLVESEERFRTVVEGAPDAIYIVTRGVFSYLNQSALRLFKAESLQDLLGASVLDRIHPDYHDLISQRIESILDSHQSKPPLERQYIRLDGSIIEAEGTAVPIVFNGEDSVLVFSRDITGRKALEREKKDMEAQMRHQQKLESIGTLAGGVAHEINNPINGIINYAQIVLDDLAPDAPGVEYLNGIIHESNRIAEIVRNLLQFSRQDQQTHSYANFYDIVDRTVSLIRTIMRKDQIELEICLDEGLPEIKCRSQQIQQVLMNLLTNARDALNEKYPDFNSRKRIVLTGRQYMADGRNWLLVEVTDYGLGITEAVRQKMFDPFYSTKPKDVGTGLGLAITFGIVREHHGRIEVDSTPGQYSTMSVHLPVDNGWTIE